MLDPEMETCEQESSMLKRRLAASVIEIERQVLLFASLVVCDHFMTQSAM